MASEKHSKCVEILSALANLDQVSVETLYQMHKNKFWLVKEWETHAG